MRAILQISNPDDMEATITLTAKVSEWRQLRKQLASDRWPSCDLSGAIRDVVMQAEQSFYSNPSGGE